MSSQFLATGKTRVAMVTNIPTPYRIPVYEKLAQVPDIDFQVVFCSGREPDRAWDLSTGSYKSVYLKERFLEKDGKFIHHNPDILPALWRFKPDVVITTGFNPTHLLAFAYAKLTGAKHIAMTDGTYLSEVVLGSLHRVVRSIVYSMSHAFVGASDGAFELYHAYGVPPKRMFKSHLCANNALFLEQPPTGKKFDFIFCARFVALKNPHFALDVARKTAVALGRRVSIVFVGSGELESEIRLAAKKIEDLVDCTFAGFASQHDLPKWYGASRLFLFPTLWEPWGVVSNEACAAGLPVLISPTAGSARELIQHGRNGYVLTLDSDVWAVRAQTLLEDPALYQKMSEQSRLLVGAYTYDNAAEGISKAVQCSIGNSGLSQDYGGEQYQRHPRVTIIQRRLTHYRVPLFEAMAVELERRGIELTIAYGEPTAEESTKADSGDLSWGVRIPTRYFLGGRLCWHNAFGVVRGSDLVVVTQENKLLFNHLVMLLPSRNKLAFWGHGRNFQATRFSLVSEVLKRWILRRAKWWFAYTETSAQVVKEAGFSEKRINVLNNAVDTHAMEADFASVTVQDQNAWRRQLNLGSGPVGIMVASLHADKRVQELLDAAQLIRNRIPGFELLVVGDGPLRQQVEAAAAASDGWLHCLGSQKGKEKAILLSLSKVMLNPGMVGLGVLDSFIAGVPMVTTDGGNHSPEIAYLKSGANGLMTKNSLQDFADGVCLLLEDELMYSTMKAGCIQSGKEITLENMVQNFCAGIEQAIREAAQ